MSNSYSGLCCNMRILEAKKQELEEILNRLTKFLESIKELNFSCNAKYYNATKTAQYTCPDKI